MPIPKLPLRLMGLSYHHHLWWWRNAARTRPFVTSWNETHRAIFVHIPKTAGTSVLAKLGAPPIYDSHAPSRAYQLADPDFYAQAYKFTVVRNPWDRFASSFHFMKHGTEWDLQKAWARRNIGDLSFADFTRRLRNPLFRATVLAERFFWPQTVWLGGEGRVDGVDEIFRFERLNEALLRLSARFGQDGTHTPHLRKVHKPDFRELYDDELIDIVGTVYQSDIKALGYRFDG